MELPKLRKVDSNKPKKKKILLLADDLRLHSGIATMAREFVLGTVHEFDWFQVGGAMKHPDNGKLFDLSDSVRHETGVEDASVRILATNGYGNQDMLRELIVKERPDAILHFTDPRFWQWLYQMEHELRQEVPLMYYTIWDDLPFPHYNEPFYESCDMLMAISKQTHNIVKNVVRKFPKEDWQITYIPHGINEQTFRPLTNQDPDWEEFQERKKSYLDDHGVEFTVFFNNRNIRRKSIGDVILAYKAFCDTLPKDQAEKCALLMHTQQVDNNGTDLPALINAVCPDYKVMFTPGPCSPKELNYLYNMSDVTINLASNEGFGLTTAESVMAGTPIIVNVTGGLQDQCGFKKADGTLITIHDLDENWGSNHDGRYKEHGEWVEPVFPACRSLQGSVPTPYIFDDRCRWEDAAVAIKTWYDRSPEERASRGLAGRAYMTDPAVGMSSKEMCNRFVKDINTCIDKWSPRERFAIHNVDNYNDMIRPAGVSL